MVWGTALMLGWTLLGGLSALNALLTSTLGTGIGQQLALVATFTLIGTVLDLPFALYSTFVLKSALVSTRQACGYGWWTPSSRRCCRPWWACPF